MKKSSLTMSFPECYKSCDAARLLGVGECKSVCPHKFNEKGDPVEIKDERGELK